jgi:hypothetical protein
MRRSMGTRESSRRELAGTATEAALLVWHAPDSLTSRDAIRPFYFLRFLDYAIRFSHRAEWRYGAQDPMLDGLWHVRFSVREISFQSPLGVLIDVSPASAFLFTFVLGRTLDLVKRLAVFRKEVHAEEARLDAERLAYLQEVFQRAREIEDELRVARQAGDEERVARLTHSYEEVNRVRFAHSAPHFEMIRALPQSLADGLALAISDRVRALAGSADSEERQAEISDMLQRDLSQEIDDLVEALPLGEPFVCSPSARCDRTHRRCGRALSDRSRKRARSQRARRGRF